MTAGLWTHGMLSMKASCQQPSVVHYPKLGYPTKPTNGEWRMALYGTVSMQYGAVWSTDGCLTRYMAMQKTWTLFATPRFPGVGAYSDIEEFQGRDGVAAVIRFQCSCKTAIAVRFIPKKICQTPRVIRYAVQSLSSSTLARFAVLPSGSWMP